MMNTKQISDVQLSPNNETVLFVVTDPKMQLDSLERNLMWFKDHLLNP